MLDCRITKNGKAVSTESTLRMAVKSLAKMKKSEPEAEYKIERKKAVKTKKNIRKRFAVVVTIVDEANCIEGKKRRYERLYKTLSEAFKAWCMEYALYDGDDYLVELYDRKEDDYLSDGYLESLGEEKISDIGWAEFCPIG